MVGFEYWEALIARNDDPESGFQIEIGFFGIILFNTVEKKCFVVGEKFLAH